MGLFKSAFLFHIKFVFLLRFNSYNYCNIVARPIVNQFVRLMWLFVPKEYKAKSLKIRVVFG